MARSLRQNEAATRRKEKASPSVEAWVRTTDWRWSLTPLSPAGSLHGIGGRFNIGRDLDRARGQAFPCLYIAKNVDTAYREYFGGPLTSRAGKLTLQEFALRHETSFTTFVLRGEVQQVFDLRGHAGLAKFAQIIARFDLSTDTQRFARSIKVAPQLLFRTPGNMWKWLMLDKDNLCLDGAVWP